MQIPPRKYFQSNLCLIDFLGWRKCVRHPFLLASNVEQQQTEKKFKHKHKSKKKKFEIFAMAMKQVSSETLKLQHGKMF